jgi:hypothetical protein
MLIDHSGLSGCKLEIISDKVIRKYSSNQNYNSRLLTQIDKQYFFSRNIFTNIDTPKIIQKHQNDLIYFDMEYVLGCDYYSYFSTASPNQITKIFLFFDEYFDFLIKNSHQDDSYTSKEKIKNKLFSFKSSKYCKLINFVIKYLEEIEINIPKSFCHGDLTISNLLFHHKKVYLIDFLDSYIDTFILDLIKLKQDLYYKWILEINNIDDLRITQCFDYLWNYIQIKYNQHINTNIFEVLDLVNFLRIEPYLTNQHQKSILDNKIKNTLLYEKFINSHGREIF